MKNIKHISLMQSWIIIFNRKISCFGGKVYAVNVSERISRILRASGMSAIVEILT